MNSNTFISRFMFLITNNKKYLNFGDCNTVKVKKKFNKSKKRHVNIPLFIKTSVYKKFKNCYYCKTKLTKKNRSIDHFIPYTDCKKHKKSNLVGSCLKCNGLKRDINPRYNKIGYEYFLSQVRNNVGNSRQYKRGYAIKLISNLEYELQMGSLSVTDFVAQSKKILNALSYFKNITLNKKTARIYGQDMIGLHQN